MIRKVTWDVIFQDFKKLRPKLVRRGMRYTPYGVNEILIEFDIDDKRVYNYDTKDLRRLSNNRVDFTEEDVNAYFRDVLSLKMIAADMSQAELARRSGISPSDITRYIQGTRTPSLYNVLRLAKGLGCSLSEFDMP